MISRHPVTLIIIILNVLIFAILAWQQQSIFMNTNADVLAILHAGANLSPYTLGGEPWRIVTCMFLHFGIIHLAVNMYGLFGLGTMLEQGIGSVRFTLLYFICGLAASIASLFFNVYVISAGASGAIFGLYGYQLGAELIASYHDREKLQRVLINFVIFVVVNAFIAGQVNVDMSGHIGGAVAGLAVAVCHFKLQVLKKWQAMAMLMLALPLLWFVVPKDQLHYFHLFQRVVAQEDHTRHLFRDVKDDNALRDSLLNVQHEWHSIQHDLRILPHVSKAVRGDTAVLRQYVALHSRDVLYRLHVLDQSYVYLDSVEALPAKFDSLPRLRYVLNYGVATEEETESDTTHQQPPSFTGESTQVFYDRHWKETNSETDAMYYRLGTRDSANRWQGQVRDYYKDGNLQMRGAYKNGLRDGIFIYYTAQHTCSSAGRYVQELAVGKWESFHNNGRLEREIFYNRGVFIKSIWDSLGNAQVVNGEGNSKAWYADGTLKEEGAFTKGLRTGYWLGYYENGKPYYKELYRDNRMVSGVSLGKDGKQYVYDALSELPTPVMGLPAYRNYLNTNLRPIPGDANRGTVKVLFNVGVDGTLWDFVIYKSISPAADSEAIRVIKEGPPWRPALLHGQQKVQSQGYIDVKF